VALALLAVPVLFVVFGLLGGVWPAGGSPRADLPRHEVRLVSGAIHTDFLLPLTNRTKAAFAPLAPHHPLMRDPRARWLLVGWGAQGFYTTVGSYADVTLPVVWDGLTGDQSVMRVDVIGDLPITLSTQRLMLSDAQFDALLAGIAEDFEQWAPMDAEGFGIFDLFYPAAGRFHLGRTCNVWLGDQLRAAGVRFGVWTPLPWSVRLSHWLYAQ